MALKLTLLGALVTLTGCAGSIANVKFEEQKPIANSRFRTVAIERSACQVERALALYTDQDRQLWLACPYRFEGKTVPLLALMGPNQQQEQKAFTYDEAVAKAKTLTREALRNCGASRYCADLDRYGYMDVSVQIVNNKASLRLTDLSGGLKDVEAFYDQLDGRVSARPLDPQLVRLVEPAKVVERIVRVETLAQLRTVQSQLKTVGLSEVAPIRSSLQIRSVALETAEFRQQGTFAGFQSAFQLTKDVSDLATMQRLASTPDEKYAVFAGLIQRHRAAATPATLQQAAAFAVTPQELAEVAAFERELELAREAEMRRQEDVRQAEVRKLEALRVAESERQEQARLTAQRAEQARANEQRCLRDANCRRAWEERRAQCASKVQSCQAACDRATGSGSYSSFIANLSAAALARTCYVGCSCESGFGDLVTRFNLATSGDSPASVGATKTPVAAKVFECKIYCQSATGPTIAKRIEAATRKEAAKVASERAGEFCAAQGKSHASSVVFAESQCKEQ